MLWKRDLLKRRIQALVPLVFIGALGMYAIWPWLPLPAAGDQPRTIVFYGFSILGEVMTRGIFPAFQEKWEAETGEEVEFVSSFAGSGTITNQLVMGVPADLALLSLELDALRLADAGVVEPYGWRELPHQGVVNRTPFIILVRAGNPKAVGDFAALAAPGVGVVHPDPLTSGGANWALVAEYGAGALRYPEDPDAGYDLLLGIWRNVVAQAASARAARTQFDNGFGDALITYEQEALWDKGRGVFDDEMVYPERTILSEHTLVVVERNIEPEEEELIRAFVAFLWSEEAQQIFVQYGFRSVDEAFNARNPAFGTIEEPFTIADFGGWVEAKREIVERIWKGQVLQEVGR